MSFLRKLTIPESEKRQEQLTAYLDGHLSPKDARRFEEQLGQDKGLQRDLGQQRFVKESLAQLPRQRAPRNFTLDPTLYGKPLPETGLQFYPVLRAATALAAFVFIALISIDALTPGTGAISTLSSADAIAPAFEETAKEAEAPMMQMVPDGELAGQAILSEEAAALAPVVEEVAEEIVEVQAEVAVEEAEVTEPAAEEPAAAEEGEVNSYAPEEISGGQEESAVSEEPMEDAPAAQNVVPTEALPGRIMGGAQETATAQMMEPLDTPTPEGIQTQTPETPPPAVAAATELLATVGPDILAAEEAELPQPQRDEDLEEALKDSEAGELFGLNALQMAEIFLGAVVVLLLFATLLLRRRLK